MPTDVAWLADTEFDDFETTFIKLSIDAVETRATLIRDSQNDKSATRAVLYLHGYNDYFFHKHVAKAYREAGYAFYALDFHGYGRSIQAHDLPNYCESVEEYFPEIDQAIKIITQLGHQKLVLNAHSTGGLVAALYAHQGENRNAITALFLNSPFLAINVQGLLRWIILSLAFIGKFVPKISYWRNKASAYAKSIHKKYYGEWDFNLILKPAEGFPAYFGWMNAIITAQKTVQAGLAIDCPVLIMHSDKSITSRRDPKALLTADAVLNIEHMRQYGPGLGKKVELITINDGMHDLLLSAKPVRESALQQLFTWLQKTL